MKKSNNNYLKYFENLEKGSEEVKDDYRTVFEISKFNSFRSSIIAEYVS